MVHVYVVVHIHSEPFPIKSTTNRNIYNIHIHVYSEPPVSTTYIHSEPWTGSGNPTVLLWGGYDS